MSDDQRGREVAIRENAMSYAVQTATLGEDPMQILARAALYADFIVNSSLDSADRPGDHRKGVVEAD